MVKTPYYRPMSTCLLAQAAELSLSLWPSDTFHTLTQWHWRCPWQCCQTWSGMYMIRPVNVTAALLYKQCRTVLVTRARHVSRTTVYAAWNPIIQTWSDQNLNMPLLYGIHTPLPKLNILKRYSTVQPHLSKNPSTPNSHNYGGLTINRPNSMHYPGMAHSWATQDYQTSHDILQKI